MTLSISRRSGGGNAWRHRLTVAAVNGVATLTCITFTLPAHITRLRSADGTLAGAASGDRSSASLPPVTTPATAAFVQVPATATVDSDPRRDYVDILTLLGDW